MMCRVIIYLSLFGLGCSGSEMVSRYCTDGDVGGDGGIAKTTDAQSDCIPLPSDTGREVKLMTTIPKDANRSTSDSGTPEVGAVVRDSGTSSLDTGTSTLGKGGDNLYPSCVPDGVFFIGQLEKTKEDPTGETPFIKYTDEVLVRIQNSGAKFSFSPCGPVDLNERGLHANDDMKCVTWSMEDLSKVSICNYLLVLLRVATANDVSKYKIVVTDPNSIFKTWYESQTKKWVIKQTDQSKSCEEYGSSPPPLTAFNQRYPDTLTYFACN